MASFIKALADEPELPRAAKTGICGRKSAEQLCCRGLELIGFRGLLKLFSCSVVGSFVNSAFGLNLPKCLC